MSAHVLTIDAAKEAKFTLVETNRGTQAVHDAVVAMRANRRTGTACTKLRGEVAGNNKKIYRQKGTGNARHGDKRAPIFVGGGVVFGPRPRDYSKHISRKTKKLAFRKALSERIKAGDVLSTGSFAVTDGKTRSFIKALTALTDARKVVIVAAAFDEKTYLAARNYGKALLMTAAELNAEHLLYFDKIILTSDAFDTLARRTAA
ncbi:MAG: 50S ribosomal protein L4 [Verrucomicrobiales bacterium]|nr:50S ribosomal protein L4 [Verrucomicrobiales bacterium]